MGDELINSIWTTFQDGVWFEDVWLHTGYQALALFPGLHTQLLSLAVRNAGGRPGRTYPSTLLSLNSVHSFCSACPVSPIATGSIVASYNTWRQLQHASR